MPGRWGVTERGREERLRSRHKSLTSSKIYHKQAIVVIAREVAKHETCRTKDGAVEPAGYLFAETRVFPA